MLTQHMVPSAAVDSLMTQPVVTIDRNARCDEADALMERRGIRHLAVMDGDRLVGVVSRHDLTRSALVFAMGYGEHGRTQLLHTLKVKEVMKAPITVGPSVTSSEAARVLLVNRIGCLPVLDDGELVGILTSSDLLRLLATTTCGVVAAAR